MKNAPLYLVRNAKTGPRSTWTEDDRLRPLSRRGRQQAEQLVALFEGLDVERVTSSPFVRCTQTVRPLALTREIPVEVDDALVEGAALPQTLALLSASHGGAVLCTHGDVIPAVIEDLAGEGMAIEGEVECQKASVWVLERAWGRFSRARYVPPLGDEE